MKIAIAYPPLESIKGTPLLSQNRQYQVSPFCYFIYPVVPACAASLLKSKGYEVYWLDGLAEKWNYEKWLDEVKRIKPDIIFMETKTPVVKYHWEIIKDLKKLAAGPPAGGWLLAVVLAGDHATALPEESMQNCPVDFVITGGDYDFSLLSIANHLSKGEKLEGGIYYRSSKFKVQSSKLSIRQAQDPEFTEGQCKIQSYETTGKFALSHSLDELPVIDRDLTKWNLYAYKNSNFYRAPGAYTMFGRDCWWGKCVFCSWTTLFPGNKFRVMSIKKAIAEVENLVENYGVKEIMDDSGSFPVGDWNREFCEEIIKRGYQEKVRINCNMRFNSGLTQKDYDLMGKAGFRFILYGLESSSQETLDRLDKNLKVEQIELSLQMAKKAGLWPHVTVMAGYPWEKEEDIDKTTHFVKNLFRKGLVDTMQATVVIPYPGTPLFKECQKNKWLKTLDWNKYDMTSPIMKAGVSDEKLMGAVRDLYSASIWNKTFILNVLKQLKSIDGIKYVSFQGLKYLGKMLEFKK